MYSRVQSITCGMLLVLHNLLGFVINTKPYHLGKHSLYLLLLKSSMAGQMVDVNLFVLFLHNEFMRF